MVNASIATVSNLDDVVAMRLGGAVPSFESELARRENMEKKRDAEGGKSATGRSGLSRIPAP